MAHHILVVEDNGIHRAMTHELLVNLGYDVTAVTSGEEAIEEYTGYPNKYAVILMDWEMETMSGLDAARAIRVYEGEQELGRTSIIAFTGNKKPGDREKCLEAGMDDYIPKEIYLPKWRAMLEEKIAIWAEYEHEEGSQQQETG